MFWRSVIHFEAGKITPWIALRNAIGVALPLAAGVAAGETNAGLIGTIGALNVAFSDGSDPYWQRARRMLAACVFSSLAVFAGGVCGQIHIAAVGLAAACAFIAGMMVAVGVAAGDIGVLTVVTFVVFSAQAMSADKAVQSGLLAFGGGLLQTALALALWPVKRYGPERAALAALFAELSRAAAAPGGDAAPAGEAPPASDQSTQAQQALATLATNRSVDAERYLALLSQAERIRLALLSIARLRIRIRRDPGTAAETGSLDRSLAIISESLAAIGYSLLSGEPGELRDLQDLAETLRKPDASPEIAAMLHDARQQLRAVAGQLRSSIQLATDATPAGSDQFAAREAARPWRLRLAGAIAVLRANLTLGSPVFRHAVRLAVCVAAGEFLAGRIAGIRGYWIPMTVAIVLKPDFTSTFSRGVLRVAGTLIGLLLATALFHFLAPSLAVQVMFIGTFAFLLRCFGPANYGVFVTALTALVVFLISTTGVAPGPVILARGVNTLAGGAIALLAYGLWPTWERTLAPEALAAMLAAYRSYFQVVRDAYLAPEISYAAELDSARLAGRLARSNLEASLSRLSTEPGTPESRLTALNKVLANSHRFIHTVMSLEAGLAASGPVPARPEFRTFANDVDLTLYYLSAALRGARVQQGDLPDLREDHHSLLEAGDPLVGRHALVNIETDRIVNSLNTLAGEVFAVR